MVQKPSERIMDVSGVRKPLFYASQQEALLWAIIEYLDEQAEKKND